MVCKAKQQREHARYYVDVPGEPVLRFRKSSSVSDLFLVLHEVLSTRFGVSPQAASQITNSLIPVVMKQFVNKTNDPDDNDFDLQDVVKNVTGQKRCRGYPVLSLAVRKDQQN